MNDQNKIVGSLLVGIVAGIAIGVLLSLIDGDKIYESLQSLTDEKEGPPGKEDWSDLNDSLGG